MPDRDTHTPLADGSPMAEAAVEAFLAGVAAADPTVLVRQAVRQGLLDDWFVSRERPRPIRVLALGKAAPRMVWGLVEANVPFSGLGVAPRGVPAPGIDTFSWLPGDHPLPGSASFAAGRKALAWCDALPRDEPLLVLLSGGASACCEVPAPGRSEEEVTGLHARLLASGKDIVAVNGERAAASALKAGRLGIRVLARTKKVRAWLLADTPPEQAPAAVGSGPFFQAGAPEAIPHRVLASASDAVVGAGLRLGSLGWSVYRHAPRLAGPTDLAVRGLLDALAALPAQQDVALVAGGEADVPVASGAPPGGRAQHAALAAALELSRHRSGALFLAGATDGVDGSTDAAGAWVTAADAGPEAAAALARLDAHGHLAARRRLIHTGPTGTNVNDVWIALRRAGDA